jgi:predicted Rossmann-fold nucleotide-binding protein
MDELYEMLTLMQTGKLGRRVLILIYGRSYWDRVVNWREMVRAGMINQREHGLLQFADTVDEAFRHIRRGMERFHARPENLLPE